MQLVEMQKAFLYLLLYGLWGLTGSDQRHHISKLSRVVQCYTYNIAGNTY